MPNDATTANLILQLEFQVALPLLVGMVGIALAWIRKRLDLQEASTDAQLEAGANATIQTAAANFAGKVSAGLADGSLTLDTAVEQLTSYLHATAKESMARLRPSQEALTTILLGKLKAGISVQSPDSAGAPK